MVDLVGTLSFRRWKSIGCTVSSSILHIRSSSELLVLNFCLLSSQLSIHFNLGTLWFSWLPRWFLKSASGPIWALTKVFLNINSSCSKRRVPFIWLRCDNSSHLEVMGAASRWLWSLCSKADSWWIKVALISRSGRLLFKNSRVFNRDHLYLFIIKAASAQVARLCPLTEWTRTLSVAWWASSINS